VESIKENLENNFKTTFDVFYLNGKEVKINGEFSSKRVDIFISRKGNYNIVKETEKKVQVYLESALSNNSKITIISYFPHPPYIQAFGFKIPVFRHQGGFALIKTPIK
jgi:hypothetical protein